MPLKSIVKRLVRLCRRPLYRRPRIVMTLLCRDEEDIIGYNIAYHLRQGVDFFIVTDNGSCDRTPRLLERFQRQGVLHLLHEPSPTHEQGKWVTRMARLAAKRFDADWVINNDADEFWFSRTGTVRDALAAVPWRTVCLSVPRADMLPPRDFSQKFYESMLFYRDGGRNVHGGALGPKICHRAYPDIRVAQGNHLVKRHNVRLAEERSHPLRIVHYPLRNLDQLQRRIRRSAIAMEANSPMNPVSAQRWRKLYGNQQQPGQAEAYYLERAPTPEQIEAGVAGGSLTRDTRIRDALRRLDPATVDPDRL